MKTGAVRNSSRTCTYLCYAQQNDCESKAFGCSQFQKGKREKKHLQLLCRFLQFVVFCCLFEKSRMPQQTKKGEKASLSQSPGSMMTLSCEGDPASFLQIFF